MATSSLITAYFLTKFYEEIAMFNDGLPFIERGEFFVEYVEPSLTMAVSSLNMAIGFRQVG